MWIGRNFIQTSLKEISVHKFLFLFLKIFLDIRKGMTSAASAILNKLITCAMREFLRLYYNRTFYKYYEIYFS
jgi:hypothetical protein